jgi:hypothetical protein
MTMTTNPACSALLRARSLAPLVLLAAVLGACSHTKEEVTASVPTDYRQRHPIVVQEADRTIEVFVGTNRGGLTAPQRTDVTAFAQTWLHEGTGPIAIDLPVSTPNGRAATQSLQDIQAIFSSVGVPARGVTVRRYTPADPRQSDLSGEPALLEPWVRLPAQHGCDGRQSPRSRAAATGVAELHHAAFDRARQVLEGRAHRDPVSGPG